jgi:hypothetical protein
MSVWSRVAIFIRGTQEITAQWVSQRRSSSRVPSTFPEVLEQRLDSIRLGGITIKGGIEGGNESWDCNEVQETVEDQLKLFDGELIG